MMHGCRSASTFNVSQQGKLDNLLRVLSQCTTCGPEARSFYTSSFHNARETRFGVTSDPYRILGVSSNATEKELKAAKLRLSKKYHPDVNKNDPQCAEKFKNIGPAYDEAIKRLGRVSIYNSSNINSNRRAESKMAGGRSYTSSNHTGSNSYEQFKADFFEDAFKNSNYTQNTRASHSEHNDRFAHYHERTFERRKQHSYMHQNSQSDSNARTRRVWGSAFRYFVVIWLFFKLSRYLFYLQIVKGKEISQEEQRTQQEINSQRDEYNRQRIKRIMQKEKLERERKKPKLERYPLVDLGPQPNPRKAYQGNRKSENEVYNRQRIKAMIIKDELENPKPKRYQMVDPFPRGFQSSTGEGRKPLREQLYNRQRLKQIEELKKKKQNKKEHADVQPFPETLREVG